MGDRIINLGDFRIRRPDDRNYVLEEWKDTDKVKFDLDGNRVKDKDGKQVTFIVKDWNFIGYYGTIESLINGMLEHKCKTSDVETLKEIQQDIKKLVKDISEKIESKGDLMYE